MKTLIAILGLLVAALICGCHAPSTVKKGSAGFILLPDTQTVRTHAWCGLHHRQVQLPRGLYLSAFTTHDGTYYEAESKLIVGGHVKDGGLFIGHHRHAQPRLWFSNGLKTSPFCTCRSDAYPDTLEYRLVKPDEFVPRHPIQP